MFRRQPFAKIRQKINSGNYSGYARSPLGRLVFIATAASFVLSSTLLLSPNNKASATALVWDMANAADFTYDAGKVEFAGGVAQLKQQSFTPGTDWIMTESAQDWAYRKKITIDHTKVPNTNQTDFPVLVKLASDAGLAANAQANGNDIAFTSSDGATQLSHEIETYTNGTGALIAWVKIPTLTTGTDTDIYMYYGNSAVGSKQNKTDVWSNGYIGVWHYGEGSGTSTADSTSNNAPTTLSDAGDWDAAGSSKIGNGLDSGYATSDDAAVQRPANSVSISTWVNVADIANWPCAEGKNFNWDLNAGYSMCVEPDGGADPGLDGARFYLNNQRVAGTFPINQWVYLTGTYDHTNVKLYINGSQTGGDVPYSADIGYPANNPFVHRGFWHGGVVNAGSILSGYSDELRTSSIARSADWVATEYNNQNDPSSFYNLGTQTPQTFYASDNPTIVPNTGVSYDTISSFAVTLGAGSAGTIKYQVSPDNGATWYWYTGGAWTATVAGYSEANIASDINDHFADASFDAIGAGSKTFKWRAYMNSDGTQVPKIDAVDINYLAPATPTPTPTPTPVPTLAPTVAPTSTATAAPGTTTTAAPASPSSESSTSASTESEEETSLTGTTSHQSSVPFMAEFSEESGLKLIGLEDGKMVDITDPYPTFRGRAFPFAVIEIIIHSDQVIDDTVTADKDGNWEYKTKVALEPGPHSVKFVVKDASGNIVKETPTYEFELVGATTPAKSQETSASAGTKANATKIILTILIILISATLAFFLVRQYLSQVKMKQTPVS